MPWRRQELSRVSLSLNAPESIQFLHHHSSVVQVLLAPPILLMGGMTWRMWRGEHSRPLLLSSSWVSGRQTARAQPEGGGERELLLSALSTSLQSLARHISSVFHFALSAPDGRERRGFQTPPRSPPSSSCCCCCNIWLQFLCNTQQILSLCGGRQEPRRSGKTECLQGEEE